MNLSLLKNTAWGLLGELAVRGAKIAQIILIARLLGAEELGHFNYSVALAGLFSVLFDFGIVPIAIKALASDPSSPALHLYGRLKLLTSIIGIALLALTVLFVTVSATEAWLALGMGIYFALNDLGSFVSVAYRVKGEFWRETYWRTATAVVQLAACSITILAMQRVDAVVAVLIATAAVGLIPLAIEWSRQPAVFGPHAGWQGLSTAALQCVPLAAGVLTGSVYMNLDIVVLAKHAPMQEVGWYSVAVKAVFALMIMPLHYFQLAALPAFASEMANGAETAARIRWLRGFVLSSSVGAALCLVTALLSEPLLWLLFGSEFVAASPVLVVFTLTGFMFYLYSPLSQWMLLQGRQRQTLNVQIVAMAVNGVAVPLFIAQWGLWGAVFAALLTHATIAAGNAVAVFRHDEFRAQRSELYALLRLLSAMTAAIAVLYLQPGGLYPSKLLALGTFIVLARKELRALVTHLQAAHQKLGVKGSS